MRVESRTPFQPAVGLCCLAVIGFALPRSSAAAEPPRAPFEVSTPAEAALLAGQRGSTTGPLRSGPVSGDWSRPGLTPWESLSAWTYEQPVYSPDTRSGGEFALTLDAAGHPWVIFYRVPIGPSMNQVLYWTRHDGAAWSTPARVSPSSTDLAYRPRATFDAAGDLWVVWNNGTAGGIWYAVRSRDAWGPPTRVHPVDENTYYAPFIDEGGGAIWAAWYGEVPGGNAYDVFVSRWVGSAWTPPENLTASMPGWHWFVDIAVDAAGQPHVVWGDTDTDRLYYVMRPVGQGWTDPELVSDEPLSGWPMCRVELDPEGRVHVVWVTEPGNVQYSLRRESGWDPSIRVRTHLGYGAWYPDLAVGQDSVWVTWFEWAGDTDGVFVAAVGGPATRLDHSLYYYQQVSEIALGPNCQLWNLWWAINQSNIRTHLYATRQLDPPVPVKLAAFGYTRDGGRVALTWEATPGAFVGYQVDRETAGAMTGRWRIPDAGAAAHTWTDFEAGLDRHMYHLSGVDRSGTAELLGSLTVAAVDDHPPLMAVVSVSRTEGVSVEVHLEEAGTVTLHLFDARGRKLSDLRREDLGPGTHRVRVPFSCPVPRGIYFLRGRAATEHAALRVPLID